MQPDHAFLSSQFYGLDWVGMCIVLTSLYLVGNKKRGGFALYMFGNVCWFTVAFFVDSHAFMIQTCLVFSMNLRNFLKWTSEKEEVNNPH